MDKIFKYRIIIAGSRNFQNFNLLNSKLKVLLKK